MLKVVQRFKIYPLIIIIYPQTVWNHLLSLHGSADQLLTCISCLCHQVVLHSGGLQHCPLKLFSIKLVLLC